MADQEPSPEERRQSRLDQIVLRLMAAQIYAGYTAKNGTPEIGVTQRAQNCVMAAREIMRQTEEG